jgi:NAD(P)-dependent dehydrogenase (short-subunit alcohol dehydrogenase family)
MKPVAGQVAVVTGAGQGIGRAIALRLAQDGMRVVVVDNRPDPAQAVAAEITQAGGEALALTADVTSAADRQRLFDTVWSTYERLDVLVNNAAIQRIALPLDVTEEHYDSIMNVNTRAVFFCCQAALRLMLRQKSGRVINIASAAGKSSSTIYHPVYNVSKAGVISITKTFAHTVASEGILVNAVCPGIVETPMQDLLDGEVSRITGKDPAQIRRERLEKVPLGRVEQPEEVAGVVAFLAGPDAGYMTGQAINVTGGMITY